MPVHSTTPRIQISEGFGNEIVIFLKTNFFQNISLYDLERRPLVTAKRSMFIVLLGLPCDLGAHYCPSLLVDELLLIDKKGRMCEVRGNFHRETATYMGSVLSNTHMCILSFSLFLSQAHTVHDPCI